MLPLLTSNDSTESNTPQEPAVYSHCRTAEGRCQRQAVRTFTRTPLLIGQLLRGRVRSCWHAPSLVRGLFESCDLNVQCQKSGYFAPASSALSPESLPVQMTRPTHRSPSTPGLKCSGVVFLFLLPLHSHCGSHQIRVAATASPLEPLHVGRVIV